MSMAYQTKVARAPETSHKQFIDRLTDHLHLQDCQLVAPSASSPTIKSILMARSRFLLLESQHELKLKVRIDEPTFVLWVMRKGTARFQLTHEIVMCSPGTGCIWPASTDIRISTSDDFSAIVIRVDRSMLEHKLSRLLGRPARDPLVFSPWLKVDAPHNIFGPMLRFITEAIEQRDSGLADSPILSTAAQHLFLATLLTTQAGNYSDALNGLNVVVVPRHLRAVINGMRADPALEWRLITMAQEAGVSVRTICESFQRFCSCTPKQFLQRIRLARAREVLIALTEPKSVADVARECGFRHPGRFSAVYHQVYGESPSETLRMSLLECKRKPDADLLANVSPTGLADEGKNEHIR